jgi:hypothetical protein
VDVSKEISPHLKYRPGLTSWKVYHKGKGKNHPAEWYTTFNSVPEFRRKVIKETMFTDTYTDFNNDEDRQGQDHADPLNLKYCMRFYPHDDNQGGFFVAVIEKILDEDDGIIFDDDYSMDAWNNPKIRQKDIIDDLEEFVNDFEKVIREQEEISGEKDDGEDLAKLRALIQDEVDAKKKVREESKGSLNQ